MYSSWVDPFICFPRDEDITSINATPPSCEPTATSCKTEDAREKYTTPEQLHRMNQWLLHVNQMMQKGKQYYGPFTRNQTKQIHDQLNAILCFIYGFKDIDVLPISIPLIELRYSGKGST